MRTGWIARRALGVAGRRLAARARPQPDPLGGWLRVDPDWRRLDEDGRAVRLPTNRTIEVTRKRSWRSREPLRVESGWWAPWHTLGLGLWAGVVGLAWWQGRRHGRGPLAELHAVPDDDAAPWAWWDSGDDGGPGYR